MKRIALFILSAALAAPVWAEPVTYALDGNHTFERFSYSHMGFSTQSSRFDKSTGTITYDAAAKTASVDVTIDTKSVSTGSALFNEHIQGADFLDTANYPTATFKSTAVKLRRRPAGLDRGQPHDQGHHQAGDADGDRVPRRCTPDDEEEHDRRGCDGADQAFGFQRRQVRPDDQR